MYAIASPSNPQIVLAGIRQTLAKSNDLSEIRELRDRAEAVRHYIKTAKMKLEAQNQAAEARLRCERRVGVILSEICPPGGDRKSEHRAPSVTLEDLGITPGESSRWRREALLPEEEFVRYVEQANEEGRELTSNGLLRLARVYVETTNSSNDGKDLFSQLATGLKILARQQKRFACIYAEPNWTCGSSKAEIARLPKRLRSLPVKAVVAPQAHLHLWVPSESLEAGLGVLRQWGFTYQAMLVRGKTPLDFGEYWRQAHDILLLGVRGRLAFRDPSLPSWADGRELSDRDRADEIQALIVRASPSPFLDLFGTTGVKGWTTPAPP